MIVSSTITSKGQMTVPIGFRRALGIDIGDQVTVVLNKKSNKIEISKPMSIDELSRLGNSFIKLGTKPVVDVRAFMDEYYATELVDENRRIMLDRH